MSENLMEQKITGAILLEYDKMVQAFVLSEIAKVEHPKGLTEDDVNTLINNALNEFEVTGGITEERVKEIVNEVVSNLEIGSSITEERVLELIGENSTTWPSNVKVIDSAEMITTIDKFLNLVNPDWDPSEKKVRSGYLWTNTTNGIRIVTRKEGEAPPTVSLTMVIKSLLYFKVTYDDEGGWLTMNSLTGFCHKFRFLDSVTTNFIFDKDDPECYKNTLDMTTKTQVEKIVDDALSSGTSGVKLPVWLSSVLYIDSETMYTNLKSVWDFIFPEDPYDTTTKTYAYKNVWVGETKGLVVSFTKPGDSSSWYKISFTDGPMFLRFSKSDRVLNVYSVNNNLYTFVDGENGFVYNSKSDEYYIGFTNLATKQMVQDMIDSSIGEALSDSY